MKIKDNLNVLLQVARDEDDGLAIRYFSGIKGGYTADEAVYEAKREDIVRLLEPPSLRPISRGRFCYVFKFD